MKHVGKDSLVEPLGGNPLMNCVVFGEKQMLKDSMVVRTRFWI